MSTCRTGVLLQSGPFARLLGSDGATGRLFKVKLLLPLLVLLGLGLLVVSPAWAETRTPPEATQHALDELANAIAQGKITFTPTPTATRTPTPQPSATATLEPTATETPQPTATPVPEPCWLTDDQGVVYADDGTPIPCDAPATPEPTLELTAISIPVPTATTPPPAASVSAAPAAPRIERVVETVVVVVTAVPIDTPTPRPTVPPVVVVLEPLSTPSPSATATSSPTATSTPTAVVVATSAPTAAPGLPVPALERVGGPDRGWLYASALLGLGLIALVAAFLAHRGRRRYAP